MATQQRSRPENQLEAFLIALYRLPRSLRADAKVFWPAFLDAWPNCDDTWPWQKHLLEVLGWFGLEWPGSEFLEPDAHAFFDFLPDPVTIFRGCSRPRVRGVSWTTDKAVAEAFACGHRGIRFQDA